MYVEMGMFLMLSLLMKMYVFVLCFFFLFRGEGLSIILFEWLNLFNVVEFFLLVGYINLSYNV